MSLIVNFDTCLFFFRMHGFIGFRLVFLLMDLSFILLNSISILLFLQNVISLSSKIFVFNWHNLFFCLIFQFNHRTRFGCSVLLSIMDTRIHFGWIRLFWFCFENDRINFFFSSKSPWEFAKHTFLPVHFFCWILDTLWLSYEKV